MRRWLFSRSGMSSGAARRADRPFQRVVFFFSFFFIRVSIHSAKFGRSGMAVHETWILRIERWLKESLPVYVDKSIFGFLYLCMYFTLLYFNSLSALYFLKLQSNDTYHIRTWVIYCLQVFNIVTIIYFLSMKYCLINEISIYQIYRCNKILHSCLCIRTKIPTQLVFEKTKVVCKYECSWRTLKSTVYNTLWTCIWYKYM